MKKIFLIIISLYFLARTNAQETYQHSGLYGLVGCSYGLVQVDITNEKDGFSDLKNNNNNLSGIVSLVYKTPFRVEIKTGYSYSYNILDFEGRTDTGKFDTSNNIHSHSTFLGAGYNFSLKPSIELNVSFGAAVSYIKNENISVHKGEEKDKVVTTNYSANGSNVYLVPEISIHKYLSNGDFISFGGRYLYSFNDSFIYGYITHYDNNNSDKQLSFSTKNSYFGLYIMYGFGF